MIAASYAVQCACAEGHGHDFRGLACLSRSLVAPEERRLLHGAPWNNNSISSSQTMTSNCCCRSWRTCRRRSSRRCSCMARQQGSRRCRGRGMPGPRGCSASGHG